MNTVYLVCYGEYSDWSIHSVHSTPERAEMVKDRLRDEAVHKPFHPYGSAEVLEWSVDAYALPILPMGLRVFRVWFNAQGHVDFVRDDGVDLRGQEEAHSGAFIELGDGVHLLAVFARDADHAKKIAQDRYATYRAEQEGIA